MLTILKEFLDLFLYLDYFLKLIAAHWNAQMEVVGIDPLVKCVQTDQLGEQDLIYRFVN